VDDLQTRIEQATKNRDALAAELQRIQTLHLKWQGVVEYLISLQAQAEQEDVGKKPIPLTALGVDA